VRWAIILMIVAIAGCDRGEPKRDPTMAMFDAVEKAQATADEAKNTADEALRRAQIAESAAMAGRTTPPPSPPLPGQAPVTEKDLRDAIAQNNFQRDSQRKE
jgi:hypothetical protein